jgi:hypothetical protein
VVVVKLRSEALSASRRFLVELEASRRLYCVVLTRGGGEEDGEGLLKAE